MFSATYVSTIVAINYGVVLFEQMAAQKQRQSRNIQDQALYYASVMASAAQQEPRLLNMLEIPPKSPSRKDHNQIVMDDNLYEFLFHWAHSLGMRFTPFLRMVIYTGLRWHKKLAPRTMPVKEELIAKIVAKVREDCITIH